VGCRPLRPTGRAGAWCAAVLTAGLLVVAPALSAPTAGQIRACVEGNGPRYDGPDTAVTAQYSDLQAACEAALADGGVIVEVTPAPDAGEGPAPDPPAGEPSTGDGGTTSESDAPAPAPGGDDPGGTETPADSGAPAGDEAATVATIDVAATLRAGAGDTGGPLPPSLSGAPGWLYALLGAAAGAIAAVGAAAVRRRIR